MKHFTVYSYINITVNLYGMLKLIMDITTFWG
jgi:hypothetical protein